MFWDGNNLWKNSSLNIRPLRLNGSSYNEKRLISIVTKFAGNFLARTTVKPVYESPERRSKFELLHSIVWCIH
jgi:hypothetical protein